MISWRIGASEAARVSVGGGASGGDSACARLAVRAPRIVGWAMALCPPPLLCGDGVDAGTERRWR